MTAEDIISVREAAEIAGRSEEAIRKAMQRGTLPARRVGGTGPRSVWATTRADLEGYLAWGRLRTTIPARTLAERAARRRVI